MIGRTVSHYKILEKLGEGGMGVVYKAEDTKLKRTVALKFLPAELTRDRDAKDRFVQEAQAASALEHQNICNIHEIDETPDGRIFICMACYEGESLRERITRGPLEIHEAVGYAIQMAEGLAEVHKRGIVHRDIKPANVFVTQNSVLKIVDFGLAKLAGQTRLTRSGTTVGTVAYMSPEQARGAEVDQRTDLWSLGVVLYETVTGRLPFKGTHEQAMIYSIVNDDPEPMTAVRSGVPLELERIVGKCTRKDQGERYQTAEDLLADLRRFARTESPGTGGLRGATGPVLRRRRARWMLSSSAVLVTVVLVGVYLRYVRPSGVAPVSTRQMVAVLPFENLGPSEDDYFADGMTDAITARLAGIRGLGVISRQSAMQYKDSGKSIETIREELGVDYVLEGTIQRERPGDPTSRVRIIPQLVRAFDDTHVWADTYDEEMSEVFAVQSEIAERVAVKLDVTLRGSERKTLEARPTTNLEAYECYLKGKESFHRGPMVRGSASIEMFEKAVDLDPEFAEAWAALSKAHAWAYWSYGRMESLSKAREGAEKALRIGPELPETYLALGYVHYWCNIDFEKALENFSKARAQRPSDVEAAIAIGLIKRRQGRFEEALSYFADALELDPRSYHLNVDCFGWSLSHMRRYAEADRYLSYGISLEPDAALAYGLKSDNFLAWTGDVDAARRVAREALERCSPADVVDEFVRQSMSTRLRILADIYDDILRMDQATSTSPFTQAAVCLARAGLCSLRSESENATAYFDSARVALEAILATPYNPGWRSELHGYLGEACAGLGLKEEAIRHGRKAVELVPVAQDAMSGPYIRLWLAEIYAMVGEYDLAIDELEYLLSVPCVISLPLVRIDPLWDPLRDHPRFQRLLDKYPPESS